MFVVYRKIQIKTDMKKTINARNINYLMLYKNISTNENYLKITFQ